jgi:hypothetical protein
MGQFLPPSLATAMEELASAPDANEADGRHGRPGRRLHRAKRHFRPLGERVKLV